MDHQIDANTAEKVLIHRASGMHQPINGSFELLPLCNMNCEMCYVRLEKSEMEQQGRLRTVAEWKTLAEQMVDAGVLFLLLTGGEPLLYPDFRELYLYLKEKGFVLTLNTNGTLIDEEWAEFFGQNPPRRVNVTLYGASNETYERLCHFKDGFDKTMRGIKLLQEQGVAVKISVSAVAGNEQDMGAILEIGEQLNIPETIDTYMVAATRERDQEFRQFSRMTPEDAASWRLKIQKREMGAEQFAVYRQQMLTVIEQKSMPQTDRISCLAGRCSFTVNWQGMMRPCVVANDPSIPVFDTGFAAAWGQIVAGVQDIRMNQTCVECMYRPVCLTCAMSAKAETGSYDGIPKYLCRMSEEYYRLLRDEE